MKQDDLKEIIRYYDELYISDIVLMEDLSRLSAIFEFMGETLEECDEENTNASNYYLDKLDSITLKILNTLNKEQQEYFLSNVPIWIRIINFDDNEKAEQLEKKYRTRNAKLNIILSMKSDEMKINQLDNIELPNDKLAIILTLQNDDNKIEQLERFRGDEAAISCIIASLKDDAKKIRLLDRVTEEQYKADIIASLKDDNKKIKLLSRVKNEYSRAIIIASIQDDNQKIDLLKRVKNKEWKAEIIKSLKDDENKISQLEKVGKEQYKADIIISMQNDENKVNQLGRLKDDYFKMMIIESFHDEEQKIKALEYIRTQDYRWCIIDRCIFDVDKKIEAMDYLDEENRIGIAERIKENSKKIEALSKVNDNFAAICELVNEKRGEKSIECKYSKISLPSEMTIGIEIEAIDYQKISKVFPNDFRNLWEHKHDSSLRYGGEEYVSPILHDTEDDVYDIYRMNEILQKMGLVVEDDCGGHVHIGADYIKSETGFKELMELWTNAEEVYYLISNEPGETTREYAKEYAMPVSTHLEKLEEETVPKDEFIEDAKNVLNDRFYSLNLMNVNNGKNTIEFRLSNGTIDADTWIENIRLYGRTVQVAQELGEIADKMEAGEELTEEEKKKYALKEMLKNKGIPLDAEMEILMQILFNEDEREVYQKRYDTNKKLDNALSNIRFRKVNLKIGNKNNNLPEGKKDGEKDEEEQR